MSAKDERTDRVEPACRRASGLSRRDFLKTSALLGGGALGTERLRWAWKVIGRAEAGALQPREADALVRAENILYSSCLQCNTGCGIKVKILDGIAAKIDGNPYNPFTLVQIGRAHV